MPDTNSVREELQDVANKIKPLRKYSFMQLYLQIFNGYDISEENSLVALNNTLSIKTY